MKLDLFLFTQGDQRIISHMSQTLGLLAESDVGTENWRWMGDTRFLLGFLRGRKDFYWVS
jgi:sphingosine kinase